MTKTNKILSLSNCSYVYQTSFYWDQGEFDVNKSDKFCRRDVIDEGNKIQTRPIGVFSKFIYENCVIL
jgi:hypothetical protein